MGMELSEKPPSSVVNSSAPSHGQVGMSPIASG